MGILNWMMKPISLAACVTGAVMAIFMGSGVCVTGAVISILRSSLFLPKI